MADWYHVDHPDDEFYDNITIEIVPRWKESELSGDEYRFSYLIKGWRKGEVVYKRSSSKLEWALMGLQWHIMLDRSEDCFDREALDRTKGLCDQPGCSNEPIIFYKRKKAYTWSGDRLETKEWKNEYRQFCDKHKHRGDCALDDTDSNYEIIPDPRPKKEA